MTSTKLFSIFLLVCMHAMRASGQQVFVLKPDRVFDGAEMHDGWVVTVSENKIIYAGKISGYNNTDAIVKDLSGSTLIPGMIEGHGHLFLYPYDQKPWNDQVLKESESFRTARAVVHAEKTLMAGFTTFRDLGTEGAGYADVGLKKAIDSGVIPGPRLIISTRAIVATGSYGPKGFAENVKVPLGAEVADAGNIVQVVRNQIGKGADFIKVYADYRWGPEGQAMPTFSREELELMVKTAESSGRYVVAHASTPEGMRRALQAGVETIEHGDGGTAEIWELMAERNIALCPTLAAGDAILQYNGWNKGIDPEPERIIQKRKSFSEALKSGVPIVAGGDVGVFEHGSNVIELEMMVEYGMSSKDALKAITSGNAKVFHIDHMVGHIKPGMFADLVAVKGNPEEDISKLLYVVFVMKDGVVYKE